MENEKLLHVGLDVGSTTVKIVVMNNNLETIHTSYKRHFSDTKNYKDLFDFCKYLFRKIG